MAYPVIPSACPRCQKVLYPISAMRPQPRGSVLAMVLWLIGGVVSTGMLAAGFYLVRDVLRWRISTWVLGPILLAPALVPGIVVGLIANRLPKRLKLRCSHCGWNEEFELSSRKDQRISARPRSNTPVAHLGEARELPVPPPSYDAIQSVAASPLDQIVDDGQAYAEIRAWIYAEFSGGRSAEAIAEELRAGGWEADEVDGLVEEGRQATRHRRGGPTRDQVVEGMNEKRRREDAGEY